MQNKKLKAAGVFIFGLFIVGLLVLNTIKDKDNGKPKDVLGQEEVGAAIKQTNYAKDTEYVVSEDDLLKAEELLDNTDTVAVKLDEAEIAGLILMREEEKLARDVYLTLYEEWGLKIFKNIAESEQTHTDAVKYLLDKYKLDDPVTNDEIGVFTAPEISKLYGKLVTEGEKSLLDALVVGATVEDLDISDLDRLMNETKNPDILTVYENLQRGSRNHLRAFNRQIVKNGSGYEAQYISSEELEAIVNSDREKGGGRR